MLYFFTGNNDFLIKEQTKKWKSLFIQKHGDFNLIHIKDLSLSNNNFLFEALTTRILFGSKKLVIINSIPINSSEKNLNLKEKENFIEKILKNIPEENIVVFESINPDKRGKLYKKLLKSSEIKEFNSKSDADLKIILQKKYGNKLSYSAVNTIIKYKSGNLYKIISELEKLFITKDFIDNTDIEKNIFPELEESIFLFIDELLNLRLENTLQKMNVILEQTNIYAFYNNLLANLRIQVYIGKFKNLEISPNKISELLELGNRSFLVGKNYKINFKPLENLYINLVNLDKKMKTGNMIGTEENDFKFELEKVILKAFL